MNQKKLSILAASLVAAFAANVASAGNVASSNPQIAREVITANTQDVKAPEASYAFQGDLNTASQIQTMQVQLILTGGGQWDPAAVTAGSIRVFKADGLTEILPTGAPVLPSVSADGSTLFVTLTFPQDGQVYKTPVVSFNRTGTQSSLNNLFSVVGSVVACDKNSTQLPFKVKHFTGVAPGSTTLAVNGINGAFEDESARAGSNNNNVLMSFPTNITVAVTSTAGPAKVDPAAGNTKFTTGVAGGTSATLITPTLLNLGNATLKQQANGYDSGLTKPYILADAVTAPAGVKGVTTAVGVTGAVEVKSFDVTVSAPKGFVAGGNAYLSSSATCAGTINVANPAVYSTDRTTATLSLASTEVNAAFGATGTNPVYVCYDVSAATAAIPTSTFSATAVLTKAPGALPFPEQNNSCNGPLFPLSGGVKIDVRNYATPSTGGNWTSVIRLINPSEVNTAVVYAQLIHADGTYGNWGTLGSLAPRAVSNMTATAINALLTNVPVSVTPGAAQPVANPNGAGDRLRITAEGVGSLRVQNYLYNPDSKNFIEASSTQGVDFDGTTDRAPALEGQYQDQDAQTGLKK
ncbi:hypothetical protein AAKU61_003253 [Undibacterium sp. GrIS 1.2]|uniref:hypothetical protein n=1 Tax=Undibacterium sp. GrIS 1.2 TaxID=3143933 RepID=UPI00339AEFDC